MSKDTDELRTLIAKSLEIAVNDVPPISEWDFYADDIENGITPDAEWLADTIRNHIDPMPKVVREFLANLVMKHVNAKGKHQESRRRAQGARLMREMIDNGFSNKTIEQLKTELAELWDLDIKTIEGYLYDKKP